MSNGVLTNLLCSSPLGQSQQPFHIPHDFFSVVSFLSHLPCTPASPFPALCSYCVSLTSFWLLPIPSKLSHVRASAFSCALRVALGGKQLVGWAVGSCVCRMARYHVAAKEALQEGGCWAVFFCALCLSPCGNVGA